LIFNGAFVNGEKIGNEIPFDSLLLGNNKRWRGTRGGGGLNMVRVKKVANLSFDFHSLFGSKSIDGALA
jgi:hypothetical protein